jgi:hypothetical protein
MKMNTNENQASETIEAPANVTKKQPLYFARGDDAMRNGSFYRNDGKSFSWYMNGDYLGTKPVAEWPLLLTKEYRVYTKQEAKSLLPKCCR